MRSTIATGATLLTLVALPAGTALARPAPPDPPVSADTSAPLVAAPRTPAHDNGGGGLATGWAILLCGGAAVAGGAVGFAGGRTHRVTAPLAH